MASNYVIRDMVTHIQDESQYRARRSASRTFRKLRQKFWLFFIIIGLSSGVGYLAVYLPDSIENQKANLESQMGDLSDYQSKFQNLSEDQKAAIMKQLGGMQ